MSLKLSEGNVIGKSRLETSVPHQFLRNLLVAAALSAFSASLAIAQTIVVSGKTSVTPIDLSTGKAGTAIPFPHIVGNIAVSPDGKIAYASGHIDSFNQGLWQINLETRQINGPLAGFKYARGIQITPDGKSAWVADQSGNALTQVDIASNKAVGSVTINEAYDLAITPDGKLAYVTGYGLYNETPPVVPVDLPTRTLRPSIGGFSSIAGPIQVTPDGSTAYVANFYPTISVTPIDLATATRGTPIVVPKKFRDMAVSPDGSYLYIVACDGSVLFRLELATKQFAKAVALTPVPNSAGCAQVAVSPDSKTVYVQQNTQITPVDAASISLGTPMPLPEAGITMAISSPTPVSPPPKFTDDVYFIGDSVTAGFGYCGSEVTGVVKNCDINTPFEDDWAAAPWGLKECKPPPIPNDRCSNNNYSNGKPWNQGPWAPGPKAPTVSYSYVIAANQTAGNAAQVRNWAMTGSEPRHWAATPNPSDPQEGIYAQYIANVKNSHVVMTLGANPLLADYLDLRIPEVGVDLSKGICADSTQTVQNGKTIAAPLHDKASANGDNIPGVGYCFTQQWQKDKQTDHLKNVYKALLKNGNRVVVMGYPYVCPWSFGVWQPAPNPIHGPSRGRPCSSQSLPASINHPKMNGGNPPLTQEQQAFYLNELANGKIQQIVQGLKDANIVFVPPSQDWKKHQQPTADAWVFPNDTWVHPSVIGHQQMAKAVTDQMCASFNRWCKAPGGTLSWNASQ